MNEERNVKMIEVKTADLIGPALDWAVAKADGWDFSKEYYRIMVQGYCPSTDWSQGGPLIDKHNAYHHRDQRGQITAWVEGFRSYKGETRLIAACRAIVAAKLGDVVQVPEELAPAN